MSKKILTIGGATQDVYIYCKSIKSIKIPPTPEGKDFLLLESSSKIEVEKVLKFSGGGATNSAAAFSKLGFDTSCLCMIGSDSVGDFILDDLEKHGVSTRNVIKNAKEKSGTSFIIFAKDNNQTLLVHRGSSCFLEQKHIPENDLKNADFIYISTLQGKSFQVLDLIIKMAQKYSVPVAMNPGKEQILKHKAEILAVLKNIDILITNFEEAKVLATERECSKEEIVRKIEKMGPKIAIVTDGANGAYVVADDQACFQRAPQISVSDTVGAGDSLGSCFVASILENKSIKEALERGVTNSSSVIQKVGAKTGLLSFEDIEKTLNKSDKKGV